MCINCETVDQELECENSTILDELDLEIHEIVEQLVKTQTFYNKGGVVYH